MATLTLSLHESVVEKARWLAKANKTTVSGLFRQFVESMAGDSVGRAKIGPLTRKVSGILDLPPERDYKELLTEALADRYGTGQ